MRTKEEIRKEVREKKRQMSLEEIESNSNRMFTQLEQMSLWKEADVIFSYVSYNQEVATRKRMEKWLQSGKKVAVPKVVGEELSFFLISSLSELEKGYQGILEPLAGVCVDGKSGIILMPGLAFDSQFHRLGYGGGFYDRYLNKYKDVTLTKIALAYAYQLYDQIPSERHDQLVDIIITEQSVHIRNNER